MSKNNSYIFVEVWLKKTQKVSRLGGLQLGVYFHWLTLLLASCSPAEPASSSGSIGESMQNYLLLKIRNLTVKKIFLIYACIIGVNTPTKYNETL